MEKTLLLVDDMANLRDTWSDFLRADGYSVLTAASPREAYQLIEERDFAIAVVDLRLERSDDEKDFSGIGVAAAASRRGADCIILTEYPNFAALRSALGPAANGLPAAVDFVDKREGYETLAGRLQVVLTRVREPRG